MGEPVTARALWQDTADVLGARHEARWLCEVAIGLDGEAFDDALDEPVTEPMVGHLDAMVARYRAGEPLQYVLGRWGFRRLDLAIDRRVLIPRPETELVAGAAIDLARAVPAPRRVADLGTGSGAIGLSLAVELPFDDTTVWITDVNPDALAIARANLAGIGRAARNVRIGEGSWYDALPGGERFDLIVANPPYVADGSPDLDASVLAWEPADALLAGADGLDHIRHLVAGASEWLGARGALVLEIGADQGEPTKAMLAAAGFVDVEIRPDLAGRDRIAIGRRG
jgi:release factor glutamine methyltransferase